MGRINPPHHGDGQSKPIELPVPKFTAYDRAVDQQSASYQVGYMKGVLLSLAMRARPGTGTQWWIELSGRELDQLRKLAE